MASGNCHAKGKPNSHQHGRGRRVLRKIFVMQAQEVHFAFRIKLRRAFAVNWMRRSLFPRFNPAMTANSRWSHKITLVDRQPKSLPATLKNTIMPHPTQAARWRLESERIHCRISIVPNTMTSPGSRKPIDFHMHGGRKFFGDLF